MIDNESVAAGGNRGDKSGVDPGGALRLGVARFLFDFEGPGAEGGGRRGTKVAEVVICQVSVDQSCGKQSFIGQMPDWFRLSRYARQP